MTIQQILHHPNVLNQKFPQLALQVIGNFLKKKHTYLEHQLKQLHLLNNIKNGAVKYRTVFYINQSIPACLFCLKYKLPQEFLTLQAPVRAEQPAACHL